MKRRAWAGLLIGAGMIIACGRTLHEAALAPSTEAPGELQAAPADERYDMDNGQQVAKSKQAEFSTESYDRIFENNFVAVADRPLSTFSVDVDTASYSNVRRFLNDGQMPPPDAVRIEELVNYFSYTYPQPQGDVPFSVVTEVAPAPWNPEHRIVHVGLQGKRIAASELPPRNLVFLIDASGSMDAENKLPLLKSSLSRLTQTMGERDRIALVAYAGASGLVLPPTAGNDRATILRALDNLSAGGSTNGGEGIELAYKVAQENFVKGGVNRVLLATDGDFNIGTTSQGDLIRLIEDKRESGVFLTVLGFGMGNYKDSTLEKLADHGNGNYAYIDNEREANKVLVEDGGATLITIAKDVKIQVEFNPLQVGAYRLIGYENRALADRDFNDDKKDAGDIGAGHSVTALYEIIPPGAPESQAQVDPLKYQKPKAAIAGGGELLTVKLRYKSPQGNTSRKLEHVVQNANVNTESDNFRFSAAVAAYGMILRSSEHRGTASLALVEQLAEQALAHDPGGHRREFLQLVQRTRALSDG